ncbi:MAG: hypothetical protein LW821_06850 [Flammeovirgaceae bacterium]|jgi:hypothetical protein|nr:hypothetical protein [Flammeovirgaceae bacterium]
MLENDGLISAGLWAFYILLIGGILLAVVFPLLHAFKTPDVFKKSLIGVGALVVVFGISWAISGSEVSAQQAAQGITENSSRLIGAGLTMFYFALFGSIIGIIYAEISKALK